MRIGRAAAKTNALRTGKSGWQKKTKKTRIHYLPPTENRNPKDTIYPISTSDAAPPGVKREHFLLRPVSSSLLELAPPTLGPQAALHPTYWTTSAYHDRRGMSTALPRAFFLIDPSRNIDPVAPR
jgi:hypothetical protein